MATKELIFDRTGHASAGDENAPDFGELGLANLDIEVTPRDWREMDEFEAAESDEDEEAIEVSDEDSEIEADSDESDEEIEYDTVGEAIYEDRLSRLGDAVELIEHHVLVRQFGFSRASLILDEDSDHPRAMEAEYLAQVAAACRAADEIARLINDAEVAKVIGWKGEIPSKLSGFGVEILFRNAGVLQGVVEAIKETLKPKVAPKATPAAKPAIVLPPRRLKPRVMVPATELVMPEWSDPFGRVFTPAGLAFKCVCGCGCLVLESSTVVPPISAMRDRMNGSRVGSKDLWRHAFGEKCIARFGRGYSMRETMRGMMDEESKREAASRTLRPLRPEPACFGSSGKGAPAAQLAKKAARAEKDRQIRSAMQSAGKNKKK